MKNPNILMIGPGKPNEANTGLGVAAYHLEKHLAQISGLTVIQPEDATQHLQKARSAHHTTKNVSFFREEDIVRELTHIEVRTALSPYFYMDAGADDISRELRKESEISRQLQAFTRQIVESSEQIRFDVIYAHDWMSVDAAIELKKQTGKPMILHMHSLDVDRISTQDHSWIFEVEKRGFAHADKIITVSAFTQKRIESYYEVRAEKIEVVYHGYSASKPVQSEKVFKEPLVLFVGRLSNQKGPNIFIEIAEEVLKHRTNTRFVIVGEGYLFSDLLERGAQKGIGDRLHFTGFLQAPQMQEVYQRADIYCMPSVAEPFGLTAVEAAGAGLPVVISRQSGASEVLPGALLADHWEIGDFARHIISFIDDDAEAQKRVNQNLDAIGRLRWEQSAGEVLQILQSQIS